MLNSEKRDGPINNAPVDSRGTNASTSFGPEIHEATERRRPPSYAAVLTARTSLARLCALGNPVICALMVQSRMFVLLVEVTVRRRVATNCTPTAPCMATYLYYYASYFSRARRRTQHHWIAFVVLAQPAAWAAGAPAGVSGRCSRLCTCDSARCPIPGNQGATPGEAEVSATYRIFNSSTLQWILTVLAVSSQCAPSCWISHIATHGV